MKFKLFLIISTLAMALDVSDATGQWVQLNGYGGGTVNCFAFNGENIFAATSSWGVLLSTDKGATWSKLNNGLTSSSVSSLTVSNGKIFAGTAGSGIFLSTNNGASWIAVDSGLAGMIVSSLASDSSGEIFAGTNNGVYFSTNNGTSWNTYQSQLTWAGVSQIALMDSNLFALTNGMGIYVSTNDGESWTEIDNGLNGTTFSLAAIGEKLFAAVSDDAAISGRVFISSDNGLKWTATNLSVTNSEVTSLTANGGNLFVGTFGDGVFISTDTGTTWAAADSGLDDDIISALGTNGKYILAGGNFGIYLSTNNGITWAGVYSGFRDFNVYSIAFSDSNFFAGTDEGLNYSSTDAVSWSRPASEWLTFETVNTVAASGKNILAGTQRGSFISTDDGLSWIGDGVSSENIYSSAVIGSIFFEGSNYGLNRSTDFGVTWNPVSGGLPPSGGGSIEVINGNLYVCLDTAMFVSTDSGVSWAEYGEENDVVHTLAFNGNNLFGGSVGGGVFVSTNNGASWVSVNNGLSSLNFFALAASGGSVFAGTETGLFLSNNNGASWIEVDSGITNLTISSLAVKGGFLYAGTDGAGVWRRPLSEMISSSGVASTPSSPRGIGTLTASENPFTKETTVSFSMGEYAYISFQVFDVLGTVMEGDYKGTVIGPGEHSFTVDGTNWPAGTYYARITTPIGETRMIKLVKE